MPELHRDSSRVTIDFNSDWRFGRGDYEQAQQRGFDDQGWPVVQLPHDWSIEGPFSPDYASATGYLPGGVGWYRKSFPLPASYAGKRVIIQFDGIYKKAEIWCNGDYLGKRPNGYISFDLDLTDHLYYDNRTNVIAVRVDHSDFADSRWYTGSGIYRNVRLIVTAKTYLATYGVFVTTPRLTATQAEAKIESHIVNASDSLSQVEVVNCVRYVGGSDCGKSSKAVSVKANGDSRQEDTISIRNPRLWSPSSPHLYALETTLWAEGRELDRVVTTFGLRQFRFLPESGLSLNGTSLKLKGVCLHHDAGCLGAAVPATIWEQRLRALKEVGCNAIRTSHNPPDSVLLDLCDRLGFLVMDEAFDEWTKPKKKWVKGRNVGEPAYNGYAEDFEEWAETDLRDMIRRDRNHPSIILWSIGNEIDYPNDPYSHPVLGDRYNPKQPPAEEMGEIARRLVGVVRQYDTTRPVTAALACVEMADQAGFSDALDVVGYNYQEDRYAADRQRHPGRVIYGSENRTDSAAWQAVATNEDISGQFLWTGIDYLGEAGRWPLRHARPGLLDLAGQKKPKYYLRQSLWSNRPMVYLACAPLEFFDNSDKWVSWEYAEGVQSHWNWADFSEKPIQVGCYTNCPQVELFLNGESMGRKLTKDWEWGIVKWDVQFQPGILEVIGLAEDEKRCSYAVQTAGRAAQLEVSPGRRLLRADGNDTIRIEVAVTDHSGLVVPEADNPVSAVISGPARILGMENANPEDHDSYLNTERRMFQGKLVIYVQAGSVPGLAQLRLESPGLIGLDLGLQMAQGPPIW